MGTYGTTHIIKDKKKIDFTDSHDGYFSFMGRHNLFSIKYMSDKKIEQLFESYTAKIEEEVNITNREVQNIIFEISQESGNDKETIEWITNSFSDDIRASVTGFGPLLYLNKNPGFTDSDSPDYIIDLDKKEFIYPNQDYPMFKLSFDIIRKTPLNVLDYFSNSLESDFELIKGSKISKLFDKFYDITNKEKYTPSELSAISLLQEKIQAEVEAVLNLPSEVVEKHEKKQEEQYQKRMKKYAKQEHDFINDADDESSGGFSIRSSNSESLPTMRKIIFLFQKMIEKNPDYAYLIDSSDWGINENGNSGGFRLFSPKQSKNDALHEELVNILEYQFKIRMNGFSSSGTYGTEGLIKEENFSSLFGNDIPGPEKSLHSLDEIISLNPDFKQAIEEADPFLFYHVNYKEAREVALKNNVSHPYLNIYWGYAALLNQDIELFKKVYPEIQNIPLSEQDKNNAYSSLLQSFVDGQEINKIVGIEDNLTFIELLQSSGFLEDMKEKMTNAEKDKYFPKKSTKMKK